MMQLQAHKKGLANGALGEGDGRKLQKLTVKVRLRLLGYELLLTRCRISRMCAIDFALMRTHSR